MEKAYDHIEWDFLFTVLDKFGFHPRRIHWIRASVTTVTCSLLFNDSSTSLPVLLRACEKGTSFPLFVYLLCMEVLT